jgi:ubiquinone/menaquinone biosynthesis C-methylase UbiE
MSEEFWSNFAGREAQRNNDNPEDYIYYRLVFLALTSFLSRKDSVLDIGGGPGRFSLDIAPLVRIVEHVDFSQAMLDLAAEEAQRRGIKNITFAKADARDLTRYRDRAFDKVLSINTPVSFSGREWKVALAEMCRVTAKASFFTVSNFISCFPVLLDLSLRFGASWKVFASSMFHEHFFDSGEAKPFGIEFPSYQAFVPEEIEREIHQLSFDITEVQGVAVLCRLMRPEGLKTIVNDERLLARFIEFETAVAKLYGRGRLHVSLCLSPLGMGPNKTVAPNRACERLRVNVRRYSWPAAGDRQRWGRSCDNTAAT